MARHSKAQGPRPSDEDMAKRVRKAGGCFLVHKGEGQWLDPITKAQGTAAELEAQWLDRLAQAEAGRKG